MVTHSHPPMPGPFVRPNFLPVMEAVGDVPFPISKRELLEQVADETVLHDGRNVALHDLIKDIPDDYFESDAEFLDALEAQYTAQTDSQNESVGDIVAPPSDARELSRERAQRGEPSAAAILGNEDEEEDR